MWHIKEKEDLRFDHLHLLHLNFNPELWNDNLCDSQLLNEWANFQLNPTPMNAFRVGNVHINPYLLGPNIHYLNTFVGVTTAPKTSSHPHIACWSSQPLLGSNSAIFFPPQSFPHVNPTWIALSNPTWNSHTSILPNNAKVLICWDIIYTLVEVWIHINIYPHSRHTHNSTFEANDGLPAIDHLINWYLLCEEALMDCSFANYTN